jgi:hypothetical protein
VLAVGDGAYWLEVLACGGPAGGPFGGGGGVDLAPGENGPCGGPAMGCCWFGNGEATAFIGVLRRDAGFGGPKSGVSFHAGIWPLLAAGTIDGELEKLRGGGAIGFCCEAWLKPP